MTVNTELTVLDDLELVTGIFERLSADLGMILDRPIRIEDVRTERTERRPAGERTVHISFKLAIHVRERSRQGCLLVPLPDAIALASFVMMASDEDVARERGRTELDRPMKEAMLVVGNFVTGACDAVLRQMLPEECSTRSDGCQGVRAGIRPALVSTEGETLLVGRARASIHDFEPFELILVLPELSG